MILDSHLSSFFLKNISNSKKQTFGSEVAHLFEHLDNEVKDNPIYDKYEKEIGNWKDWESQTYDEIELPTEFEKAKSYAYDIYKRVAQKGSEGYDIVLRFFPAKQSNFDSRVSDFNDQILPYFIEAIKDIVNANPEFESDEIQKAHGNTVFIIHGHDHFLKTEVQLLLERVGVLNVVLHERADGGRNIIDKLIEESNTANYAIALLSPDDTLNDGSKRARQNVILEIGYFLGKLGKSRVRLIKKGETEMPSDLIGILYENYDEIGSWKIKLCKELLHAGIALDMKAVINNH